MPSGPTTLRPAGYARRSHRSPQGEACPAELERSESEVGLEHTVWYVQIIRSVPFPDQEYTGATEDERRTRERLT